MAIGGWLLALVALGGLSVVVLFSIGAVAAGGFGLSGVLLLWAYYEFGDLIWQEWRDARRPMPGRAADADQDA